MRLAYWEVLIALRSGGIRIALLVFSILLFVALALGVIRTQQRQNDSRLIEEENALVQGLFEEALQGVSEPESPTSQNADQAERLSRLKKQLRMSARSPYLMSHSTNLWNATLFPSPLSPLSVGASQSWPDRYRIQGISFAKTVQRSDEVRPVASVYGPFDVAFVIMAIAPLIIIGLTFNVSSSDRESGLQNLTVAQTRRLGQLMMLRCFVRAALVIGLVVLLVNATLLIAFGNQVDLDVVVSLFTWNVVTILYLLFWGTLSHFVNSFAKSSATNGAALLLIWLLLVMVVPGFVSHMVRESITTLPESQLVDLEKRVFDQASETAVELVSRFRSQHPKIEIDTDDEQQMALVNYLLAHRAVGDQAGDLVNNHYSANLSRAKVLNLCDWVSPAISFRNQSDQSSGNSERAFIAFSAYAANVQASVAEVFLRPSIANEQCDVKTIAGLPHFQDANISRHSSLLGSLQSIVSLFVWLFVFTVLGTWQYRALVGEKMESQSSRESGVERA